MMLIASRVIALVKLAAMLPAKKRQMLRSVSRAASSLLCQPVCSVAMGDGRQDKKDKIEDEQQKPEMPFSGYGHGLA